MAKIKSTLLDNTEHFKVVEKIKQLIKESDVNQILIATGFWDIPGTMLISEELDDFLKRDGKSIKLLIGKDPTVFAYQLKELNRQDLKKTSDAIKICLSELQPQPKYDLAVKLLKHYCDGEHPKFCIHIFDNPDDTSQFFHSKCWIFAETEDYGLYAIIGSSNFTQKGLEGNSELNFLESNDFVINASSSSMPDSKGYLEWFKDKWKNSEDWTKEFLLALNSSPIGKTVPVKSSLPPVIDSCTFLSPRETYLKLLIDQFGDIINFDGKITPDDYMPHDKNFKQLTYQKEAVNQGFAILREHHGFILADVVGLGKTFTALMVVKRHLLESGFSHPVLIITPPAIKQSWIDSIEYFDKDEIPEKKIKPLITLTTIGCLDEKIESEEFVAENDFDSFFRKDEFSMIVVDESHRFRNNSTRMYQKLDDLIGSISPQPDVVLLSATPQNNAPYDLRNQIYLFQRAHNESTLNTLGKYGKKLENYFAEKQNNYEQCIKKDKTINGKKVPKTKEELAADKEKLIEDSEDIRKRIVEPLVIRRTRTDIEKFYADDMSSQGLTFPKIQKPVAIPYEMSGELGALFNDTVNIIAPQVSHVDSDEDGEPVLDFGAVAGKDALGYYRYRAIEFLKTKEARKKHEVNNLTVSATSQRLAQIMELLLVKRLESSQAAFKESLHNLHRYSENMIKMWDADRIFICPDIDVNKELSDEAMAKNGSFENCLDVIAQKAKKANKRNSGSETDGPNQEYKRKDFYENYIEKLKNDLELINSLCSKWDVQTSDPKMSTFIFKIASDFLNPARNKNKKLVIFTECIATQKALVQRLGEISMADYKVLSITAANRDDMKDVIAANFDANYKGEKKDDYQILITTDVLAEGVNLHRANSILNYDSPWNATRLMQRLGRINRIGTDAKKIWNYNFYPSTLGDKQINLKNRTYVKLQSFHELFGEDSQIFSTEEEVKHFDKVVRDEMDETETPIMPYISELREFKKSNPSEYERLSAISGKIVTTVESDEKAGFSALHETDKSGNLLHSFLYVSAEDGSAKNASQLEFFEKLKPLSDNAETDADNELVEKYKTSVLNCYAADKQNATISMRSKLRKGEAEIRKAAGKIKKLYSMGLSEEYENKLDEIANSISDKNFGIINKVLEMNFENEGLGNMSIELDIDYLYKFTQVRSIDTNADVAIEFIVK
ncbi:helicase-related protein [Treponema saccharophilum]|uniref:Helicase domain protein n=1 Tax=Treponema saccharophilum DSM 2985 TaxID=907348 RepID=H7ENZ9_9SPIR|nr:helicase-related protein [Treponema saccharophilum]EIC00632.1 helicase domain protein [Treponema saccharophilum DSM 2985]BDC95720.1 ATP-dependent helicase [Treponema saccharophilum]